MKIVHCIQGLEATSGVSVFCAEVARSQAALGHDVTILYGAHLEYKVHPSVKLVCGNDLGSLGFLPDLIHQEAVWGLFCRRNMVWARQHGIPYIVSVHGCLMPRVFTHGWMKKTMFFNFGLRRLMNGSRFIHCTSEAEREAVRARGLNAPCRVVPLGCYLPEHVESRVNKPGDRIVLFLGRIGEEKGLMLLLDAWKLIGKSGWRLVLAGPDWLGYERHLREKIDAEKIKQVEFIGAVAGDSKDRLYRAADVFVLSSPMENFSAVVLDALAYQLPVIATRGTPWQVIQEKRCGWWIPSNSVKGIADSLQTAMNLPAEERELMGARARVVAEGFAWDRIAQRLELSAHADM